MDKKISELTEKITPAADDLIALVDSEAVPIETKKLKVGSLILGAHKTTHEDGGSDEISIAALSGEPAELTTHKGLTTGIHGVGAKHVAAIESAGAEAPLKLLTHHNSVVYLHENWNVDPEDAGSLWTKAGAGSIPTKYFLTLDLSSGAVLDQHCSLYTYLGSGGTYANTIIWTKLQAATAVTASEWLFGLWEALAADPPALTAEHYGFKVINGAIYATNADGTTEKATDTGISFSGAWAAHFLEVRYISASQIEYYVDGVLKATHTVNIPSFTYCYLYFSCKTTEAVNKGMRIMCVNSLIPT